MKLDRETAGMRAAISREEKLTRTFASLEQRMRASHATHLGHPYNLTPGRAVPDRLQGYLINTMADTQDGPELAEQEREAMAWLMRLWGCLDLDRFWGAIGASASDGNLWGLYLGREMLPNAMFLYGADAHASVPKAAQILRLPGQQVASLPNGEMDIEDLGAKLRALAGRPVIVALTCGTPMKGAHDDIAGALTALQAAGYDRDARYVHVDGALNAMVLPFLQDVPSALQPSFEKEIDSLSTAGHMMIGTPMPCGALVARKDHILRAIKSVGPQFNSFMGVRNGHAILALWARLFGQGYGRFANDALRSVAAARHLSQDLASHGVPALCNAFSLTVVFPEPPPRIVRRYQLACLNGQAHAVVMPSVTDGLLARFLADYVAWWAGQGQLA